MQSPPHVGSSNDPFPSDPLSKDDQDRLSRTRAYLLSWLRNSSLSFLVVAGITVFVFAELRPDLLFSSTLDVGGDNAGHVVAPYYLIHDLLPRGQLSGWDPQWFNGFPLYVFYFPLPAVLIGFLSWFFSYAVAFKLITVAGSIAMPFAAYLFGRLSGFRRPIPEFFAIAILPFLFNTSYTIDGGNLASTMAGEFSFTLAMTFGILFLGVFVHALRTGRKRWLAALLFALTLLCHVVPALFCVGTAVLLAIAFIGQRPFRILFPVGIVGALLGAFWLLPFGAYLRYSSSMGYTRVPGLVHQIFPLTGEIAVIAFALIGAIVAIKRRERVVLALVVSAIASAAAFQLLPSGLVYNGRWLPFWFLTTALVGGYGFAESLRFLFRSVGAHRWFPNVAPIFGSFVVVMLLCSWLGILPVFNVPVANRNFVSSWIAWNYSGYQSKPGWPEYSRIITMLENASHTYGCGRLDYEYSPNIQNDFGSTLVEMAFPLFTNGCIDVTEGLYYESSTTTDFHFLDQSQLSIQASNPVVGIPYQSLDVADGIHHLQLQGVKYFLANSPRVESAASVDPDLVKIASTPATPTIVDGPVPPSNTKTSWVLYEIKDSPLVEPLHYLPAVESGLSKTVWQTMAISWYQDEQYWPVPITSSGPKNWPAAKPGDLVAPTSETRVPDTVVSHVESSNESFSFDVSRTGTPVLVKIPYFPNWHVSGATGPYESTPNLMIVVPTQHHVVLTYGTTSVDTLGKIASGFGLVGMIALRGVAPRPSLATRTDEDDTTETPSAHPNGEPMPDHPLTAIDEVTLTVPDNTDEDHDEDGDRLR